MSPTATVRRIVQVAIAATGLLAWLLANAQQSSTVSPKMSAKPAAEAVHSIVLPQFAPEIANGPNKEVYQKNCLICHTARYVSMQPRFSKTVWQSEVKKMVDAYGAPIPEADQPLIVEYLVAVKGIEPPATGAAPAR
jgi:sulfite dehydrogenase (cytochrome) subunit B